MSEIPKNGNHSKGNELVVTDSVHERFREGHVYCDICKIYVVRNSKEISKHFNNNHPSTIMCHYCKNKVFKYRDLRNVDSDIKESREFIYHKCSSQK
ncbi:uncharacterized protein LOC124428136 [Vespa crabro]|uniref:uncharacterized protein LOC124428136 n=1 Tax=Vespa crabro TaxID=7445 RepID=UPI001F02B062|nr:uncharacterized protein LOC124428136 [Vespa crabro]